MKQPFALCLVIVFILLMSGTSFGISYCKDIAPTDTLNKTFDDQWNNTGFIRYRGHIRK